MSTATSTARHTFAEKLAIVFALPFVCRVLAKLPHVDYEFKYYVVTIAQQGRAWHFLVS